MGLREAERHAEKHNKAGGALRYALIGALELGEISASGREP